LKVDIPEEIIYELVFKWCDELNLKVVEGKIIRVEDIHSNYLEG
jgi:hypothetical protein